MQRLGGARLLHVPVFPVRPPSNIRVRFKHKSPWSFTTSDAPLRSNYKTFEASTLVLDLDAEDSPYVRPYNDDVDGVPAYKSFHMARNLDPMKERVAQFNELSRNYRKFSKMTASKKFSPWRISDHDILSVALNNSSQNEQVRRLLTESDYDTLSISLDNSSQDKQVQRLSTDSDPNSHPDEIANDVLKWNGIPFHVWNSSSKTIAYMRRRQQLSYRLQPIVDDEKSLIDALWACTNFPIFERLVTSLVQAPQGCQLVSNCGKNIGSTSESNLPDTAEKPGDAVEASDREALSEGNKALAFAHAIHAAIRTNNRFVELAETPGFARATEQYNMDCQLDMDTIINSADIISARGDGQLRQVEGSIPISAIWPFPFFYSVALNVITRVRKLRYGKIGGSGSNEPLSDS
ncbi:hypothetical protein F4820DRAFT_444121 [Hypoxylon rubiginosum]|uniref:Uncharacterized protein n=1 Tax=Hypoxylon rubiginosum TaxID=110542 RepID=A0ACB9ZDR9_9PEZI|nr:hypothetical protein F4820DRAFT_444121 [Hypoxylon rubiginosum]